MTCRNSLTSRIGQDLPAVETLIFPDTVEIITAFADREFSLFSVTGNRRLRPFHTYRIPTAVLGRFPYGHCDVFNFAIRMPRFHGNLIRQPSSIIFRFYEIGNVTCKSSGRRMIKRR